MKLIYAVIILCLSASFASAQERTGPLVTLPADARGAEVVVNRAQFSNPNARVRFEIFRGNSTTPACWTEITGTRPAGASPIANEPILYCSKKDATQVRMRIIPQSGNFTGDLVVRGK